MTSLETAQNSLVGGGEKQNERTEEFNEEYEELQDNAEYAAQEFGLKIPRRDTLAMKRLINTAQLYAKRVDYQNTSSLVAIDPRRRQNSDRVRRELHNELCNMLLGKSWEETAPADRHKISNFAVTVAGYDQYVGTF